MTNLFEEIKRRLPLLEAVELYGIEIVNGNKALCPFHNDTHPSLSFKNNFFKCFVCGISGSVIDFVIHYFQLTAWEAAKKLNDDFSMSLIETDLTPHKRSKIRKIHAKQKEINTIIGAFEFWKETAEKWFQNVFKIFWKIFINFAPQNFEEPSRIWLIATSHLKHIECILEKFSSSSREELLEKYTAIEGWKYKILKELEVF